MQIVAYDSVAELDSLEDAWRRLGTHGLFFVPGLAELRARLKDGNARFRLLTAVDNAQIRAIACFLYHDSKKFFHLGGKKLFQLPVKMATLFGSCIIGEVDEDVVRDFFRLIIKKGGFDVIDVGYTFVDSPLYNAVNSLDKAVAWQVARKKLLWWLIRLPRSFDAYMASLPERTRYHISRDCRKFAREAPEYRFMQRPDELDFFLRDAAEISRLTYQWKLDYGLRDDANTRQKLLQLAESGMLRCYVSYIRGQPCAFGWGDLTHGKFYFRQTGYDPAFRKLSPGTAMIMHIIKDMIENSDCRVFHFQWGGDEGYKSRLATESHICTSVQIAQIKRPYALLIAGVDRALNLAKNSVGLVVERGPLKLRFRGMLRRNGVGTF